MLIISINKQQTSNQHLHKFGYKSTYIQIAESKNLYNHKHVYNVSDFADKII